MWEIIKKSLKNTEQNIVIVLALSGYEILSAYIIPVFSRYIKGYMSIVVSLIVFLGTLFLLMGAAAVLYKSREGKQWTVKDYLSGGLRGLPAAFVWFIFFVTVTYLINYTADYFRAAQNKFIFIGGLLITFGIVYLVIYVPVAIAVGKRPGEAFILNKKIVKEDIAIWLLSGLYILLVIFLLFIVTATMYGNYNEAGSRWLTAVFVFLTVVMRSFTIVVILSTVVELLLRAQKRPAVVETVDTNLKNTYNIE